MTQRVPIAIAGYEAVAALGFNATKVENHTGSDAKKPAGCSLTKNADGSADAFYNTAAGSGACERERARLYGIVE